MLVGFVLKRQKAEAEVIARQLIPWLVERGHTPLLLEEQRALAEDVEVVQVVDGTAMGARAELLVVLGGDGTLLHGAALVGERVPVLGVNLGTLGFLVPFAPDEARIALERALAGDLPIEDRLRLRVRLHHAGGVTERFALNDAVLSQGAMARLVELSCRLDGVGVALYKADGLIVSTPTGSTAYNLAAGGPILTQGQSSLAITPICPHTLTHRPLVVPAASRIEIEVAGESRSIMLTVDGQWAYPLAPGDRVELRQAQAPLRLYHSEKSYFEILREKLSWGSRG